MKKLIIAFTFTIISTVAFADSGKFNAAGAGSWSLNIMDAGNGNVSITYDGNAGLTTSLGRISWGRLYGNEVKRAAAPIAIGVTGYTVNTGLTTFPTIQRKNYTETALKGLRSTGAIRVFGLS